MYTTFMSIQKVIRMGHPTLKKVARPLSVQEILGPETQELIQDMLDTMQHEKGIGIAAPQINRSVQAALIKLPHHNPRYPEHTQEEDSPLFIIFNPQITILDETLQGFWEGCLSVPGLRGFVERPRKIKIDYLDEAAQPRTIELEGFLATVFQHELDHLFGILYVERIKDMKLLSFQTEFDEFNT